MKQINLITSLFAGIFLLASASVSAAVTGWGTYADIQIKDCALVCNPFPWDFPPSTDPAPNPPQTSSFDSENNADGTGQASAVLNGSNLIATPNLTAFAEASDRHVVYSYAVGAQGYTYDGVEQLITLDFNLTANLNAFNNLTAEAQVRANIAVIFTNDLMQPLPFGADTGSYLSEVVPGAIAEDAFFSRVEFLDKITAAAKAIDFKDSISFNVMPGDEFLIWASLDVTSEREGIANALSTLTMDFFAGNDLITDPQTLMAAMPDISEIPLPAGAWLFLTGIGLVAGLSRRRKTAVSA